MERALQEKQADSTKVCSEPLTNSPTAHNSPLGSAVIPRSSFMIELGFGLVTIVQVDPSQRSISVRSLPFR